MSIQEQIEFISNHYKIEILSETSTGIVDFKNNAETSLETYLKKFALTEHNENLTRVFLVREKTSNIVVFYFTLRCGILYQRTPNNDSPINPLEKRILQALSEAHKDGRFIEVYERLNCVEDFRAPLEAAQYYFNKSYNNAICNDRSEPVYHTFPAIELKEFVKNEMYKTPENITISFGALIFWGFIVPHIQCISKWIGAKYLYLFSVGGINSSLYHYYKNMLCFTDNNYCVLKPEYDQSCHALIQKISDLQNNYEMFCAQNSLEIKDDD